MNTWKPKLEEKYYFIELTSKPPIIFDVWNGLKFDKNLYRAGNCFKTKKAAQEKLNLIKQILKGI